MELERNDDVFVLHLGDGENRYNAASVHEFAGLVREVLTADGARGLVVVGDGKFWSNGLDLEWMQAHPDESPAMIDALHDLYADILGAPFPTVAALQGHCYAGAAIMSMAFDLRVMRADRGYFCFPEVSIGIPFSPGMSALIAAKLAPQAATRAMVFGTRFTGTDALAAGIVDETADEAGLLARAIALAAQLAPASGATMGTIKSTLYAPVLEALRSHAPIDVSQILKH
jgi:enoyl-CoA hydratase/carnithine racemase